MWFAQWYIFKLQHLLLKIYEKNINENRFVVHILGQINA